MRRGTGRIIISWFALEAIQCDETVQNRHVQLAEVKFRKSVLDESRPNLSNLFADAYYVSHHENYIWMIEHMVTKINSLVTLMSEQLNSLGDTDRDLAQQDGLLIKEQALRTVYNLRTRISYLQRNETTTTMKNKTARKRAAAKANVEHTPVIPSPTRAKRA